MLRRVARHIRRNWRTYQALLITAVILMVGWRIYSLATRPNASIAEPDASSALAISQAVAEPEDRALQKISYATAPPELQGAIYRQTKADAPSCVSGGQIVDYDGKPVDKPISYAAIGYASVGIGCGSDNLALFAKAGGDWQWIATSQGDFNCQALRKYNVPLTFMRAIKNLDDPNAPISCTANGSVGKTEPYRP